MEPIDIQRVETEQLLEEAIASAHRWEADLGDEETQGKAEETFRALREGQLKMDNPEAFLQRLNPEDFKQQQIDVKMADENGDVIYLLKIPVLLLPERGAEYRLLESQFIFNVETEDGAVGIKNIFPRPEWKPVLQLGGELDLGLDSELNWGAELEKIDIELPKFEGELEGCVSSKNKLTGFLQVMPFKYGWGYKTIEAQFTTATAVWRLDSADTIREQQQVQFVILFKTPKDVTRVTVEAAAQAEPSFSWLTAQIRYVFERLPDAIKQIINQEKGLPLQTFQTWTFNLSK